MNWIGKIVVLSGLFCFADARHCRTLSTYSAKNPVVNKECVFPFKYNGKTFTECTDYKNRGRPWCATEVSSKGKYLGGKWGECHDDCTRKGGCRTHSTYHAKKNPVANEKCVFPFTYRGKTFSECTAYKNSGTYWCATEVSSKGKYKGKWGECHDDCPREGGYDGTDGDYDTSGSDRHTLDGYSCTFPFLYNGTMYYDCTRAGYSCDQGYDSSYTWCATQVESGGIYSDWGWCKYKPHARKTTSGGNCKFPFIYKGQEYRDCTRAGYPSDQYDSSYIWCATHVECDETYSSWDWCNTSPWT